MDGERLAMYRVAGPGRLDCWAKEMDAEQRSDRRVFLRKKLLNYPKWANLSNDELDSVRLYRLGDGFMFEDAQGYETYLPASGISRNDAEFRKVRAMMPFAFLDKTGKDFEWSCYSADISNARNMVNMYILKFEEFRAKGMGLYISSATKGSGKTMLACCLMNEIAQRYSVSMKFIGILDLLEMTKKGFRTEKDSEDEMSALYSAGLLVIDDIGVQMSREWVDTVLYRLVNDRYANKRPTIYTSNVAVDHLKIDDRISDRIESTTFPVTLPEESIRRMKRQQEKDGILEEIENGPIQSGNSAQGQA